MSASKFIRNSGGDRTVTYGGRDYVFPGAGDTTLVPGDVADFVEQNCFREGLQIVHPEAEALAREAQAAVRDALEAAGTPDLAAPTPEEEHAPAPEPPAVEPETTEPTAPPDPPVAPKPGKPAKTTGKKKG